MNKTLGTAIILQILSAALLTFSAVVAVEPDWECDMESDGWRDCEDALEAPPSGWKSRGFTCESEDEEWWEWVEGESYTSPHNEQAAYNACAVGWCGGTCPLAAIGGDRP